MPDWPSGSGALEEEGTPQPDRAGILIELEADPTTGYAAIQNAIPVIRSLRLVNHSTESFAGLEIHVSCNPQFARPLRLRLEELGPHETRRLESLDMQPDHDFLAELSESVRAQVVIAVLTGSTERAYLAQPMEVLAYDQWAGTRALPELLAAFCMPNAPAIDVLIGKASKLLRVQNPDLSMDGYQSKSRDIVWKQVSAIYGTIAAEGLQYAEPPASFGTDGQKIRTPERLLEGGVATCLDLALLFAACLEQAGLRPVVLIQEGHAWVGVWLHCAAFPDPLTDDVQAIRKRVEGGELLVFETTGVAQHHSHRPSLRVALEQGRAHLLQEQAFRYAIDIHRARELQIRPLPTRAGPLGRAAREEGETIVGIEPAPDFPPLDPGLLTAFDVPAATGPEGRLARWKAKLLDLTLRNRLLNFKPTKTTLALVAPDLSRLEEALAGGREFTIRPSPDLMEGRDPRVAEVHRNRHGVRPLDQMALEALANNEMIARVTPDVLDGTLLTIATAARSGIEEGGANTLYVAFGLLAWAETPQADTVHLAPILLVPVTLHRQSVRSGFRLVRHDEEAIINPTLLQLLKSQFEMRVAGLEGIPLDDKGVDVAKILQAFRLAVREIPRWEVQEAVHLGIFSFTKYLMWKDLQDRTAQLKASAVVAHLIDHPGEVFPYDERSTGFDRLDETHKPQDILTPLLADSSQLKAICSVDAGSHLVLKGPPGTGKSQTIANLIAHSLGKGKTVLFVSEKITALEVVHRRLVNVGLAPFCLELHSAKAKKADIVQKLGEALHLVGQRTTEDWLREAERLGTLRHELNSLVTALHRPYPNGLTVYEAMGFCIAQQGPEATAMPWTDPQAHDRDGLERLRDTVRRLATRAAALPGLRAHRLALIGQTAWSPDWQDELLGALVALDGATQALKATLNALGPILGQPLAGLSLAAYTDIDTLADLLLLAPTVPAPLARQAQDAPVRAQVQALVFHGTQRESHWAQLGPGWRASLATLEGRALLSEWSRAGAAWWPQSVFLRRRVHGRLAVHRESSKQPIGAPMEDLLGSLAAVNVEDQVLRGMHAEAERLLPGAYGGLDSDWGELGRQGDWAQRLAEVVTRVAGVEGVEGAAFAAQVQSLVAEGVARLAPPGEAGRALLAFRDAWRGFGQHLTVLESLAKPLAPLQGSASAPAALERMQGIIADWRAAQREWQPWCLWRMAREEAVGLGLGLIVADLEAERVAPVHIEKHFDLSYRQWWVKKVVGADPILAHFSSAEHASQIQAFGEADARFQELTKHHVVATLSGRVSSGGPSAVGGDTEMGKLRRELQKQRRHLPVRQLVQSLPTLLPQLKPCLLMSPLSVAQYLAAGHAPFDLVVFDEASQIPVWDAIGAIARGKQLVVVGDPKQLPPTTFFARSTDADGEVDEEVVEDMESILDECLSAGMHCLSLQWHYRSQHESLITFSNVRYYDSSLITFPSPVTDDQAVRFAAVAGVYDRGGTRTNRREAEVIVKAIEDHILGPSQDHQSLGVVTFNQPQKALIDTLLDARRRVNPALDRGLAARQEEPLFVKNLESVQGDERDIIFFSTTYGLDAAGKMTMNFGPLNGQGGHRRLNVAISRARTRVVIYSSLSPDQIDLARVRAAGVRDLKHYLEFAQRGPTALLAQSGPTGREPESPFETAVITRLRDRGWDVHPQVGCSGYRLDMAVVDPRVPGRYLLGIECDGRSYHSAATARDRDRLRQQVLEGLGWRIHRVWSTDWWRDPVGEIEKLDATLRGMLEAEASPGALPEPPEPAVEERPVSVAERRLAGLLPVSEPEVPPYEAPTVRIARRSVYKSVRLPSCHSEDFYDTDQDAAISAQLTKVIETEGPLSDVALFRKVARAWGLERTGPRIVSRLKGLLPPDLPQTQENGLVFYWSATCDSATWMGFRVAGSPEATRRHVADLCLQEISNGIFYLLEREGGLALQVLAKTLCQIVGMARVTVEAEARVLREVDALLSAGYLIEQEGIVGRAP